MMYNRPEERAEEVAERLRDIAEFIEYNPDCLHEFGVEGEFEWDYPIYLDIYMTVEGYENIEEML